MELSIVSHDVRWKQKFLDESDRIRQALGRNALEIHHIGSTCIPDILAKPIIDILVEAKQIDEVDRQVYRMSELRYEALGEYGISGRRYFRKSGLDGRQTFHVHVFQSGSPHILRHIAFREFLLANADIAQEYSNLKAELIASLVSTSREYQESKAPFVEANVTNAVQWFRSRQ